MRKTMLAAELARELEITVEAAIMLAEPNTPAGVLAERIYDSEPALMARLMRPVVVERLVWMLYRKKERLNEGNQLILPGFEKLPRRMTLPNGSRMPLQQAKLDQLRQFRAALWKRRDPRIQQLDDLITLVQRYPGKSVAEAITAEKAKLDRQAGT